jgi:hypothetical protein
MMSQEIPQAEIFEESQTLWKTGRQPAGCNHCRRIFLTPSTFIGKICPLCRLGKIDTQPARLRPVEPERFLPFDVSQVELGKIYSNIVSSVWIKPDDFNIKNLQDRTVPVFWPVWLVDSDIKGHWQMEAGFDYRVESSREVYVDGQWRSIKKIEPRIRWEPRMGELETHVDNVAVFALEEHQNRQQMTGIYQTEKYEPFDPQKLGEAFLEVPDLPPESAWPLAKPIVDKKAGEICQKASGAQHFRNFAISANYAQLNWTQFYLPMYTTYYKDDDGQSQILVINGQTGRIEGPRLASRKRGLRIATIIAAIAGVFFIVTLISLLLSFLVPEAATIAALLGIIGFGTGVIAIVPAVWPGQWNRKQSGPKIAEKGNT